jgi:hypothetical protein
MKVESPVTIYERSIREVAFDIVRHVALRACCNSELCREQRVKKNVMKERVYEFAGTPLLLCLLGLNATVTEIGREGNVLLLSNDLTESFRSIRRAALALLCS